MRVSGSGGQELLWRGKRGLVKGRGSVEVGNDENKGATSSPIGVILFCGGGGGGRQGKRWDIFEEERTRPNFGDESSFFG